MDSMQTKPALTPPIPIPASASAPPASDTARREAALALEAAFLEEMLKHAGFGKARESFGGGIGEDQFGSLLRGLQAREIAEAGGVGLAESLFRALGRSRDA